MRRQFRLWLSTLCGVVWSAALADAEPLPGNAARHDIDLVWAAKISMRDGVPLNATIYKPHGLTKPVPVIFTMTPYISDNYHDRAVYFARNGYVFALVDVRGRGNSAGKFIPFEHDGRDGHDVVEWLARQPWCNGKVAMWGGSYAGFNQWATLKEAPPHLCTIVPAAAAHPGVDFPAANNIFSPYLTRWLTLTSGVTPNAKLFGQADFWSSKYRERYLKHIPFRQTDTLVGNPSPHFQKWLRHRMPDPYLDGLAPAAGQYAGMNIPILTITGHYDDDQPGAMMYYRRHMQYGSSGGKARHYLLIGPWDHAGTRTPTRKVGGVNFAKASLLDLNQLHKEWYDWTLKGGKQPDFLKKRVAYYVAGAEEWKFADSLETIPAMPQKLYLTSSGVSAHDVFQAGSLSRTAPTKAAPAAYVYDPLDTRELMGPSELGSADVDNYLTNQRLALELGGKGLVYHSEPFAEPTEISGYLKLVAWIALDVPDTDFAVAVFEIKKDGTSIALTEDRMRARYRASLRQERLVKPGEIDRYEFQSFTFFSRRLEKGSRLRLVFWSPNSRYTEKNYNSGGEVAAETKKDARTAHITLHQDAEHPSYLELPVANIKPTYAEELNEPVLAAARRGDAALVKALLGKNANVNAKAAYGATPLSFAADKGHLDVVKVLLAHKADVNARDTFYGATPLTWAVMKGHAPIVEALLDAGAQGADQALAGAAFQGRIDTLRLILKKSKPSPAILNQALVLVPKDKKDVIDLLEKAGAKRTEKTAYKLDAAVLQSYVGAYRNDEQMTEYKVVVEDGRLVVKTSGFTLWLLEPTDKTRFQSFANPMITVSFRLEKGAVEGFTQKIGKAETVFTRVVRKLAPKPGQADEKPVRIASPKNWPSFRGLGASGVADGQMPPTTWDTKSGRNIRWKTPIPGLGHSCPIVWGDRVFLTTAVSAGGRADLKAGLYGDVDSVKDNSVHTWHVLCLDRLTGKILWDRLAHKGSPK